MYGYVYKITLPNTYSYIGSHRSETFDENYWGSSENYKYWKALFLAGKENVKREILCWCMTEQDLIQAEYKAILENNERLYNLSKPKTEEERKRRNYEKNMRHRAKKLNLSLEEYKEIKKQKLIAKKSETNEISIFAKTCPICSKEFEINTHHPNQKYCSRACASRASRAGLSTKPAWNKGLTKNTDERIKRIAEKLKGKPTWSKGLKLKNRKRP